MTHQLIIIGAGPGGYEVGVKAAKAGLQVLVVEARKLGGTCLNEGGNTLGVVAGVDAGAYHVALLRIQELVGIFLVLGVVLTEYEGYQVIVLVHDGQGVQLMIPDDVVGFLQGSTLGSGDQLLTGSHKGFYLFVHRHTAYAVVTAGYDTEQLTVGLSVFRYGDGGVTQTLLQLDYVRQSLVGAEVGVGVYEASLVIFHTAYHFSLILNALGAVDEGYATLFCESDGHTVVGYRLHDGGNQGDIHGESRFLAALEFNQRGFEGNVGGDAVRVGITGNKQILTKGVGQFVVVESHSNTPMNIYIY